MTAGKVVEVKRSSHSDFPQFQEDFPTALAGEIDPEQFTAIIQEINGLLQEQYRPHVLGSLLSMLTLSSLGSMIPRSSRLEPTVARINRELHNVQLLSPAQTGFLCIHFIVAV